MDWGKGMGSEGSREKKWEEIKRDGEAWKMCILLLAEKKEWEVRTSDGVEKRKMR